MTIKKVSQMVGNSNNDICIEHSPSTKYTVLTGIIDGQAFYDALSMRTFEALKFHRIIYPCNAGEIGTQKWVFQPR